MRIGLFFSVLFVVLAASNYLVFRQATSAFRLGVRGQRALAALLALGFIAMFLVRAFRRTLPEAASKPLVYVGMSVELAVLIAAALMLLSLSFLALARAIQARRAKSAHRAPETLTPALPEKEGVEKPSPILRGPPPRDAPAEKPSLSSMPRRDFLERTAAGAALFAGAGASAYGVLFGRHDYALEEVVVRIPGLPRSLEGYAIAQISDIHLGLFVGEPEMRAAEELVRKARADVVAMTGDLIDHDPAYAPMLGRLARRLGAVTREGVIAIPGNHDHYTGIDEVTAALEAGGAAVLSNGSRLVARKGEKPGLALLGVDDVWARRRRIPGRGPDLDRALLGVPGDLPRVLLAHNPVYFPEAAGKVALQISGHTHGGQVNVGPRLADYVLPFGYVAGLYEKDGSKLYVNRGFGVAGPPARIGAPPEITRIVLVSG